RLDLAVGEGGTDQADAAGYVVPDAARRDDAPLVGGGRGHAADAEAVAPVDVGHRQAGMLDAGQERHVGDLLGRLVLLELLHEAVVGEDETIHAHAGLVALGDPPAAVIDALERAVIGVLW